MAISHETAGTAPALDYAVAVIVVKLFFGSLSRCNC